MIVACENLLCVSMRLLIREFDFLWVCLHAVQYERVRARLYALVCFFLHLVLPNTLDLVALNFCYY